MSIRPLNKHMDNSALILFRIFFGILVALECFGAIATGWVRRNLIEPEYTFPFIDFEWLHPLQGTGMYGYFALMGLLGLAIALGLKYRLSIIMFTLLWSGAYFMQKTAYNNHYYLLMLISLLMCFFPANRDTSLDAKLHPEIKRRYMPSLVKWIVVGQLFLVYTYAATAKLYGDWLAFDAPALLLKPKENYPIIGNLLQQPWLHAIIGTTGIVFDFLIVPALLWKPTRKVAFACSIVFHLFNSVVFQIGIFPYLSLAFTVFFVEPQTLRAIFFKHKTPWQQQDHRYGPSPKTAPWQRFLFGALCCYFVAQLLLPLRHFAIQGDVLWTEEGHRMSWRMMLRSRHGKGHFKIVDRNTKTEIAVTPQDVLTPKQLSKAYSYPDFAWQFAQLLKRRYAALGKDVSVYLKDSKLSVNGKPYAPFIDPQTDLANTAWDPYKHHHWILPAPWEQETNGQ